MRCAFVLLLVVLGGWTASHFVPFEFVFVVGAERPADRPVAGPCRIYHVSNTDGSLSLNCTCLEAGQFSGYPLPRWQPYGVAPLSLNEVFARPGFVGPDVMGWAAVVPFWLLALPPGAAVAWYLWRRWRARKNPPGFPLAEPKTTP